MKPRANKPNVRRNRPLTATNEMLLLPDGRVLVHNLTPAMARLLHALNPDDPQIAPRTMPDGTRTTPPAP